MNKIIIDEDFWNIFPDAQINIMLLKDINNHPKENQTDFYDNMLEQAGDKAQKYLTNESFKDNLVVANWREAYQNFKKKKGARSSIEALLKRVDQGKGVGSINPLVDLYNSISLEYGVPVGGEDTDAIKGDLHLGVAKGGEAFYPLGDDKNEPALLGEVLYYDDDGAVCRCLNWRDGKRTMLTDDIKNAVMVMESVNKEQNEIIDEAMLQLQKSIKDNLNVEGKIFKLNKDNSVIGE